MSYNSTGTADQRKVCPCCAAPLVSQASGIWSCPDCGYIESTLPHIPIPRLITSASSDASAITTVQYGWICPKCDAVISPWTVTCPNCTHIDKTITCEPDNSSNYRPGGFNRKEILGYE